MRTRIRIRGFTELFLLVLLSYPLFYYSYKFGSPDFGNSDFYSYYKLYSEWRMDGVESPFNMRLISTFLIYSLSKLGLHYDTAVAFNHPEISKQIYFNAILFNYVCTVLTSWLVFKMIWRFCGSRIYGIFFAAVYLLGFGILFYSINTLTDSFSYFLFTAVLFAYLQRSFWAFPLMALAVFQRENIFLIMGLVSLADWWRDKASRKYAAGIFALSVIGFSTFIILRMTVFHTPKYADELEWFNFLDRLIHPQYPAGEYFRQVLLNQNLLGLYFAVAAYKLLKKHPVDIWRVGVLAALILQAVVVSLIALIGNNIGRFTFMLSPLALLWAAMELKPLLASQIRFSDRE